MKDIQKQNEFIENFTKMGVGNSILFSNKILICTHSSNILFFKRDSINHEEILDEKDHHLYHWKQYHSLPLEGNIFHNLDSEKIIITTLEKIYLYIIDPESLLPQLQSVMYNNIKCRYLISSPNNIAYIKYNVGQSEFEMFNRKYMHCFRAQIDSFTKDQAGDEN